MMDVYRRGDGGWGFLLESKDVWGAVYGVDTIEDIYGAFTLR